MTHHWLGHKEGCVFLQQSVPPCLHLHIAVLRQQPLHIITALLLLHSSHLAFNAAVCLCSGVQAGHAVPSALVPGSNDDDMRMTNMSMTDVGD